MQRALVRKRSAVPPYNEALAHFRSSEARLQQVRVQQHIAKEKRAANLPKLAAALKEVEETEKALADARVTEMQLAQQRAAEREAKPRYVPGSLSGGHVLAAAEE